MRRGYSLIECLVVLVIIAILAALGLPTLRGYLERSHDQVIQQQLVQVMRFAQQTADARGITVGVARQVDALVAFVDTTKDGLIQHESQVIYRSRLNLYKGELYWRAYPQYRHYFVFNPRPAVVADNGVFWYCRAKQRRPAWAVMVNKASQVQVAYPGADGAIRDSRKRELVCR